MLILLRRKARSALWRLKHDIVPYLTMRIRGELGYRLGFRMGTLRGWRPANSREIVWAIRGNGPGEPRLLVARFKNAYVYRDESIVISADYRLVSDISTPPSRRVRDHDVLGLGRLPDPVRFSGNVATVNASMFDDFYHWMLETVPRFGLLEDSGVAIDKFMVSTDLKFQAECLQVLGIVPDRTVCPKSSQMLVVDDLIAPSIVGLHGIPTRYSVQYLPRMFARHLNAAAPSRRIYITRADALARRVVNEAALVTALAPFGFEVVRLSELPLTEQARTFSEAEIVIGPHGAGMTHVVFQQPQSRGMIEFMPETYSHECFRMICDITGTPYRRIVSRTRDPAVHDIEVDVARMIDSVREALNLQP